MSELTDAVIQLFGPQTGLVLVILVILDGLQTKYLRDKFDDVEEDIEGVRKRVERVEGLHMATDGGNDE